MGKKEISHSNKSNRISDSTYDASVHSSDTNTVNELRTTIEARNNNKTIKNKQEGVQMKNGDPADTFYKFMKSFIQFILGSGEVFLLIQVKFLNSTQILN